MGIDAWTIGEGLKTDLEPGRRLRLVICAIPLRIEDRATNRAVFQRVAANYYGIAGTVTGEGPDHWVLDAGFRICVAGPLPDHCRPGGRVAGLFRLVADDPGVRRHLAGEEEIRDLESAWRIDEILRATKMANRIHWLENTAVKRGMTLDSVEGYAVKEESSGSWERLDRTDWFNDDGGTAFYLIVCTPAGSMEGNGAAHPA